MHGLNLTCKQCKFGGVPSIIESNHRVDESSPEYKICPSTGLLEGLLVFSPNRTHAEEWYTPATEVLMR